MSRAANRPQRSKIGRRNVLVAEQRDGYQRRIVNDEPGRIAMFEEAGWKQVNNTEIGDQNVGEASRLGSASRKPIGGGKEGVLMEIPIDWYKEDQAAKEAHIKEKEQGLLLDEHGNLPDSKHVYGAGVSLKTNKAPTVQID